MDLPSSASSPLSLNLAIGKREYQTRDTGDFSFCLINLRDNLIVTLRDAEGNEISRTDVQTKTVVEKVIWDDIFLLNGGGRVHMKLQFILSEDERRRIRDMRESALKKKEGDLVQKSLMQSETEESPEIPVLKRIQSRKRSYSSPDLREESIRDLPDRGTPVKDFLHHSCKSATSTQLSQKLLRQVPESTNIESKDLFRGQQGALDCLKPPPVEDTNSHSLGNPGSEVECVTTVSPSSVKKLVSAFESSQSQGVKHHKSPDKLKSSVKATVKNYAMTNPATKKAKSETDWKTERFQRGANSQQTSDCLKPSTVAEQAKAHESHVPRESEIIQGGTQVVGLERKLTLFEKKVSSDGVRVNTMVRQGKVASDLVLPSKNSLLLERDLSELRSPGQDHAFQASREEESVQGRGSLSLQETSPEPAHSEEKSNNEVVFPTDGEKVNTTEEHGGSSSGLDASTSYRVGVTCDERTDESHLSFQSPSEKQRLIGQSGIDFLLMENYNSVLIQDGSRHFCMTSVSNRVRKYVDGSFLNPEAKSTEEYFPTLEEKHRKTHPDGSKSGMDLGNISDPKHQSSKHSSIDIGGLIEQALSVALIVACGALFLGTVQRKTR